MFSVIVSGSHLLKHWIATHFLDSCLDIPISDSKLLKHWRGDPLAGFMFSHSCQWLLKPLRANSHAGCMYVQPFSSVVLICLNTWKQLTNWMCVQPFLLVKWESNSLPGCISAILICWNTKERTYNLSCVFSQSCQLSWSAQTLENDSQTGCRCEFIHSHQWFWSAQKLESELTR